MLLQFVSFEFLLPSDEPQTYVVKAEEPTDPAYGYNPLERPLKYYIDTGIVNLDKVAGPTSHEVASWVKKILGVSKTGHGGTLDPQVTGILPVAIGTATRVISALLTAGKEYVVVAYLHDEFPPEKIKKALQLFIGPIYQRPPIRSSVARNLRIRHIYYIEYLQQKDRFVMFRVGCEAGTYMRKLCFDLGEVLMSGAHMVELRRTRTGTFREDNRMCTLQDLKDAMFIYREEGDERFLRKLIYPMEKAVEHWKKIYIRDTAVDAIAHGANLAVAGILYLEKTIEKGERVAVMTQKGELVSFGRALMSTARMLKANHGIAVKTEKVFIPRNLYPSWKKEKTIEP